MRKILLGAALAAVAAWSGPASAYELPDGIYGCYISGAFLGEIEIDGDVCRGPAYDRQWEGDYPFEVTDGGTIDWGGPLGGMSLAGTVVGTVLKDAGDGRFAFDITIQNERGNFQTASCLPQ